MGEGVIRVENVSKRYEIGVGRVRHDTLRDEIMDKVTSLFRKNGRTGPADDMIWALKDVSFEVRQGEVLGIIGRNGAGKSTLLKILSRITPPTKGRVEIHGRVGSLLEVGTGFHPELTGAENIYLNGAILGMTRAEIKRKFDAIVAFSEVERFIHTPVKRYSSGMYVRLAFAVAAHLQPHILIVDEVLAVGDLSFQQKCLKHLKKLTAEGLTILLVSHNMAQLQSACQRLFYLEKGAIVATGEPVDVIERYRRALHVDQDESKLDGINSAGGSPEEPSGVSIVGFEMFGEDGIPRRNFKFGEAIKIRIDLYAKDRIDNPMINFGIRRADGVVVSNFNNWYDNFKLDYIEGECSLEGWLPPLRLIPEFYEIHVLVWQWGGGHLPGDMTGSMPLASTTFGEFCIHGPGLNAHDGVFQVPARKWRFRRGAQIKESATITPSSLEEAFQ